MTRRAAGLVCADLSRGRVLQHIADVDGRLIVLELECVGVFIWPCGMDQEFFVSTFGPGGGGYDGPAVSVLVVPSLCHVAEWLGLLEAFGVEVLPLDREAYLCPQSGMVQPCDIGEAGALSGTTVPFRPAGRGVRLL